RPGEQGHHRGQGRTGSCALSTASRDRETPGAGHRLKPGPEAAGSNPAMNIFRSGGIVVLILILFIAYSGTFVVDEREKALVMRFGDISRIEEKPGLNFKIPIAETVIPIEDRLV